MLRTPALRAARASARGFSTSAARRGGHSGGSSHADTVETFFDAKWATRALLVSAAVLLWPYLPERPTSAASPSLAPAAAEKEATSAPSFITRAIASGTKEDAENWAKRNDQHLALTREQADEKILVQEAERPKVWRMRYPSSFEQASPHGIPVGSQADLSDLKVKSD
ncbi:uncharacterized protein LOC62_04G006122 [Vanrija pseudolonga]|uniref:Uncharacterized protein n=1 Tax=Vanrija pseudolonga TaxID=143232 RepID=A0AAF0Y9N8_9TREE|nr:hypothetical protein LOC62_04G006122 [Vanrija pseudolonga]